MQSKATTVAQYLAELPDDRRIALEAVRRTILDNIDDSIEEGMQYGMIGYYVPHRLFPQGYHCDPAQPVPFAGLGSQKGHMSLYMMCAYMDSATDALIRAGFEQAGKRLDMGKACIRFKRLDDLPFDVIGRAIRQVPGKAHLAHYVASVGEDAWKKGKKGKSGSAAKGART